METIRHNMKKYTLAGKPCAKMVKGGTRACRNAAVITPTTSDYCPEHVGPRPDSKAYEDEMRRAAKGAGYCLLKGRSRYGGASGYMLIDPDTNGVVSGTENGTTYELSLADVEAYLTASPTS